MLEHVNWVQQNEDYATRYHVLQWKTSHFHEPYSRRASAGVKQKQGAESFRQAKEIQAETEGLGFGQSERTGSGRLGLGLGLEKSPAKTVTGNEKGHDGVNISAHGAMAQEALSEAAKGTVQSAVIAQTHAAEHTVTPASNGEPVSGSAQRKTEKTLRWRSPAAEILGTAYGKAQIGFGKPIRGKKKRRLKYYRSDRTNRKSRKRNMKREPERPTGKQCLPCRLRIIIFWIPMIRTEITVCLGNTD